MSKPSGDLSVVDPHAQHLAAELPAPPHISVELIRDLSPVLERPGFLRLVRGEYRAVFNGQPSTPFEYDRVTRRAVDAAVIVAHFEWHGETRVYLRSSLRPPMVSEAPGASGALWELPAGLIEPDEVEGDGPARCAARELEEELGFRVPLEKIRALGPAMYPVPGMIHERQLFFEVEVEPGTRGSPGLDGSVLEDNARIVTASLAVALDWCRQGLIPDLKTELGLRRLAELCSSAGRGY
ncbi:MAG: hypothetical protein RJA70_143 [Pseudomonadota bacterium]|jgi:ADP-ribose pyrophosphatase